MKLTSVVALALASAFTANTLIIPENARGLSLPEGTFGRRDAAYSELERRKGGGGGGRGGGSSSGGEGGGEGSSGSSGSGEGEGSSGSSSSSSSSSSSNRGGSSGSSTASGVRPAYGSGGRYYGGGATVPYTSGLRSPNGLLAAGLLSIAALSVFHGAWLYPAYYYPYSEPYTFYNASAGANQTKPVECLCEQYQECGCEDNTDPTYMNSLLGNGSTSALNQTLVQVNDVNGTSTILINGTLPNGTTAAGGTSAAAGRVGGKATSLAGWTVIGGAIACSMLLL